MKVKKKLALPSTGTELVELLTTTYAIDAGAALVLAQAAGQALDAALEAEKLIVVHGVLIEGERGLRANPACAISRDSRSRLLAALGKLNLEL